MIDFNELKSQVNAEKMTNVNRYYGFDNTYGLRTDDGETGRKIGKLYAFRSKEDRDNWVANDPAHDGNLTREPMAAPEAQAWWKADLNDVPEWDVAEYGD